MAITYNQPTLQFCVEVTLPGGSVVDRFIIEQKESKPGSKASEDSIWNQVQSHLNDLSLKTGLDYEVVRWGDPKPRPCWLAGLPIQFDDVQNEFTEKTYGHFGRNPISSKGI